MTMGANLFTIANSRRAQMCKSNFDILLASAFAHSRKGTDEKKPYKSLKIEKTWKRKFKITNY
jgi:hypothetical protein